MIGIGTSLLFDRRAGKAALPSPDLYYDLSLKSNEHPTRNIIDDMSGNGRHATIYNALYAKGSGYGESGYEGAFVFDGIDDYARIENITKGFKTLFMEVVPFKTGGMLFDQRMMDAVQVGGRNLVRNSNSGNFSSYSGSVIESQTTGISVPEWGANDANRVIVTGGTTSLVAIKNLAFPPPPIEGSIFSQSGYFKNNSAAPIMISANRGERATIAPGEAKRIVFEGKVQISTLNVQFQIYSSDVGVGVDFTWWRFKVEYGNKATDWSPAPEDVFAISNLPNTIAYNRMNPNGVTYINGELNTNKYTDDMQNHRQVITIVNPTDITVNPTDTTHGSASIGAAFNFSKDYSSMALYKVIGFYDELTPAQIQKVITKYNLKYEQI